MDLNTATREELMLLPGVGDKTAGRILEKRAKTGGFKSIEDLMTIKGIGEKKFDRLKPYVIVNPSTARRGR